MERAREEKLSLQLMVRQPLPSLPSLPSHFTPFHIPPILVLHPSDSYPILTSTIEPDKRTLGWCKVKKDYADGSDSMDLIPIGAWHGSGRKAGWWSPILLAVRNEEDGTLQAVCKCISGFTDQFYKDLNITYSPEGENTTFEKPWDYESALTPDSTSPMQSYFLNLSKHFLSFNASSWQLGLLFYVIFWLTIVWFVAREVWEMRFADVTLSPVYTAAMGLVSEERGLSMRFPRFIKVREDKSIEEASTGRELAMMWEKQNQSVGQDVEVPDEMDEVELYE